MSFNTPILFLVFNRPDTTSKVFEKIKQVKPKYLFVAADGPRENKENEKEICKKTREVIVNNIDWNCEVKTLFREKNLGCGKAVSEAITWFFDNVEMGIILEDDCLPSLSFFSFCENLLCKYQAEEKIMMISGLSMLPLNYKSKYDYFFHYLGGIWGWATWQRAWNSYKSDIAEFDENAFNLINNSVVKKYFIDTMKYVQNKQISTWDIQWTYSIFQEKGLTISPIKNLISNIGFAGTHSSNNISLSQNLPTFSIELKNNSHPKNILYSKKIAKDYEKRVEWVLLNGNTKLQIFLKLIKNRLYKFLSLK